MAQPTQSRRSRWPRPPGPRAILERPPPALALAVAVAVAVAVALPFALGASPALASPQNEARASGAGGIGVIETIETFEVDEDGQAIEVAEAVEAILMPSTCRIGLATISALVDNDSFAGQRRDGGYTSGVRIDTSAGFAGGRSGVDRWLEGGLAAGLDTVCAPPRGGLADRALFLVQDIYTPGEITVAAPQPDDRPWAAMLALGRGWETVGLLGSTLVARRFEVAVQVVGPTALGRQSQTLAHRWISGDRPEGWDNQLQNRWALAASYLERYRWSPSGQRGASARGSEFDVDIIPHWGLTLGPLLTQARLGATLRLGDAGCTIASPGVTNRPIALAGDLAPGCDQHGRPGGRHNYLFAGIDVRGVARNDLIEGRPRRGENRVSAEDWVGDLRVGYAVGGPGWNLSLSLIRRTAEFRKPGGERCCAETFGTIGLGLGW